MALLHDTIALCESLARRLPEPRLRLVLAYSEWDYWFSSALSADWWLTEQRGEDLGERLENALGDLAPTPEDLNVFIGMDCPQMPPQRVLQAFDALVGSDTVLGPYEGGGYYLLGVRGGIPQGTLNRVSWGTGETLGRTIAALEGANLTIAKLLPGYDVYTADDLQRLAREIAADRRAGLAHLAMTLADLRL